MRVLVVDDHQTFRRSFIRLLDSISTTLNEYHEAGHGIEALEKARQNPYNIVFLDISMPVMNGYDACTELCLFMPPTSIIILTQYEDKAIVNHFANLGVSFTSKNASEIEIKNALNSAINGVQYIESKYCGMIHSASDDDKKYDLTDQEKRLIGFLRFGYSSKQIAQEMRLSQKTVETYRERILRKTKTKNVAELVGFFLTNGFG